MSTSDQLSNTFLGYLNLDMSNHSYPPFPDLYDYITPPSPSVSYTLLMMPTPISSRLAPPPTSILAPQTFPDPPSLPPFPPPLVLSFRKPDGNFYWQCRDKKQNTPTCTCSLYTSGKNRRKGRLITTIPLWPRGHEVRRHCPPSLWNCCAATLDGDPRTNNASERGNNALKHATTSNNPCIWSFVPTIRALNSEMEQKLLLLWQNIDPERPQRPRWRFREETIKRLVETYNSADKVGTMRAIGLKFEYFNLCIILYLEQLLCESFINH